MKRIKVFIPFILIGIVVLFSLGKTLQYYFYTDDFVFIYQLQHNIEFGWPYYSILTLFRPIYNLFGTNIVPYLSLALLTYFLAATALYFFVKKLTSNKLIALLSALIFATGYIGIDQFTMITVSIVDNLNIVNICITLILLILWVNTKKLRYYFLTFLMFWFSMQIFPYRAFPLILFLPTLEFIKSFKFDKPVGMIKQFFFLAIRYTPFVLLVSHYGVFSYSTYIFYSYSKSDAGKTFLDLFAGVNRAISNALNFEFFKEMFAVLGRFVLVKPVSDIFGFVQDQNLFALIGFIFFLIILLTSLFFFFGKKSKHARSLLIVLLLTIEGYIGNMILITDFDSNGVINRYLTLSFFAFSIIIPLFLFLVFERIWKFKSADMKWFHYGLSILIVLCFAFLSRQYEDSIIRDRSIPAKNFFSELKSYVPKISNYSVFYFDNALYAPVASRFGYVLSSAATSNNVNLAMPYKVSMDLVRMAYTFDDFLKILKNPPKGKKISYYTFYDDEKGLHNTTDKVFDLLKNGSFNAIEESQIQYDKTQSSSVIIKTDGVSSLTPVDAKFNLRVSPLSDSSFTFPYVGINNQSDAPSIKNYYQKIQKDEIFNYLLARQRYYKMVKVDVESIHIAKQNPAYFLVDDNPNTYWLSDESRWQVNIMPWVKLDLGETKNISEIVWRQLPTRIITGFTIETSIDGSNWNKIGNINQHSLSTDPNLVINSFSPVDVHYIKLTINNLAGGLSPGPGLAEIEAIESQFRNIDLSAAQRIKDNPFEYIKDESELMQTYSYLSQNAKVKVIVKTNKDDPNSNVVLEELPIVLDGQSYQYKFQIPQGGTKLKSIQLNANFPADFSLDNVILVNLSQDVLNQQIEQKCQQFEKENAYANPFICN